MPIGGSATCSSTVWCGDRHDAADGDDREDQEGRDDGEQRRQPEDDAVGARREAGPL